MAKNNKIIYDPKYARLYGNIGQSMRRSTAEDLRTQARADAASNINYNPEYTSEYAQTGGPGYYQPDNLENIDNTENEKGWLDKTSEFIGQELYNLYSIPQKLRNFDYTSAWNLIVKKQLQARLGNEEEQLQNLKQEQQDLQDFSDFVDKYNQYKRDIQNLRSRQESGDIYGAQLLQKDIESKYQGFQDQINYYTQAIRTNPTLQSMMYNTAASNLKDNTRIGAKVIYNALDHVSEDQPSNPVLRFFNKAIQGAANFADFVTNPSSERHTRAAIARGALNDDDLSKLQKYDINNLNGPSLQAFKNEINKRLKTLQPDVDEQQSVVNDTLNLYRKGSWFYNPKSIDKTFEEKNSTNSPIADLHEKGIDALLYSLPEIGSSFSSIEAFMSQLGIQWVGGAVSKTLATKSPIAGLVAQVATQLGSLATAYAMRKDETNSEATDAYLQRVQDSSIRNRINLGRILNITKQFCKSNGIETDGLNEQDLLQLALSYNIQTGDSEFEKIKRDARQGINKLKAQNNALGYMDYIEVLPFAGSSGSIIKNYADNIARKMVYKKSLKYTADDVFDATANLAENSITSETKRRLAQSWISKKIDGVLKKYGGTIESQIAKRNLFNSALDLGKKASFVAAKEGLEEGQQAFLQNRYQRGLYDEESPDYDYGRGIDLRSLMDNQNLATEAALAYFGLDFGDPLNGDDQLRQQMEIGALTSLWFGLGHQVLANATNNPESLRKFVSQYKFDKNLMRYVANNYKQQQDDVHLGMFFDRFKNGGNAEQIEKSYDAFKYLKNDDVIKDQDLDDDVSLAKTAYGIYKTTTNKKNTILSDLNITKDSEDHKEYVKQASRVIFDFKNVSELVNRSNHDLMTSIQDIIRKVKEYKEGESTDIENEALLKSFKELLQKTYVSDQKKNNDRISQINKDLEKLHDQYHKSQARPVLTDESEIQKQKEADEAREKEYQEKIKPLNDEKEKLTGELELSQDDYLDRIVTTLISLKQISTLKGLYKQLDTQKDKLSEIKKAFGYKLNIESLYGMKNAIKEQIEKLEKQYKPIVEKGDNKKLLDKYKDLVDDQSLSEKIVVDALNKGILQSLSPKYQAYVFNAVDPRSIAYAIPRVKWENLTDDQRTDFQNNLIREKQSRGENTDNIDFKKEWINRNRRTNLSASILKKKRSDIEQNRGTDKGMLPIDEQEAIEKIDKDAALLVIGQNMSDRFRRKQMVRLEKEQNAPLTIEDLDNANDGDKKAQQKISDAAKQQLEEEQKQASEKSKQQLDKSDIDAHQRQIDDARKKVYGEKSDELTESAKRKAEKATLTNSALDRLIDENVEGGLNGINTESVGNVQGEGNVQEEDEQLRISNQSELKRQAFIKAIELLRNKPKDDTTDPSTYIQEKLNIPEEWADEFVDAYNEILKKELQKQTGATTTQNPEEQQDDSQISDENHLTEPKIEEASDEQVTANTQEGQIVNNDDNIGQIVAEVGVEIQDDGTVKIIPPAMQEETPQNGEVNQNTGEHTDKSLIDEVAPDESGDEGDSNKKEEQKELHDSSMDNTAIGQLATMLQNNLLINIDVAKNIARQFIENWVRGLSFDDCINNMEESVRTKFDVINVLKGFYDAYPIPQAKDLIIDPVQNTLDLNKIDVDDSGNVTYSGKQIKDDPLVFSGLSDIYDSQVDESKVSAERSVVESKIGNPFNYAPDSTKPMVFKHNKTPLFTDKRMATGSELNQKLSIPGWFGRISKMYYIVSGFDKSKADDLTVALIMEDPDDSNVIYNVSMRRPSSKSFRMGEESDLLHIIKRLKFLNVNTQLYEALLDNAVKSSTTAYNLKNKTQLSEKEWCKKFNSEYQRLQELCRLQSPISNSLKVFTNNEIEDYLQRLREQRNQIIDAYCIKNEDGTYSIPQNVREDIQPQNVQLTNGGLNNQRNDVGIPIQRTIFGEDGGFGLSSTIDGISEDIENGSVQFGIGTGPFGENPGPNRIRPINGTAEEIPGTGKAGKLYIKVPEESQPGTSKKQVYAQLSEQKFGPDLERDEDDIEESFTLDGVADLKNPPSLAEIAFRLILGRVDKQSVILGHRGLNTIGLSDDTIEALSDLLINHGKQTLIGVVKPDEFGNIKPSQKNAYLSHILGFYSDKQLAYIEHVDGTSSFYIGDRDDQGKAFLHEYKIQDFFPGENASQEILDQCAKNRRHVISLIERNMHWNTNLERLMSTLDNAALYSVLDQYFFDDKKQRKTSNGKPISTFNPFGNSDFSFEYDDFYNQDGSRKNPIMLAWMIKNGKITTDVGTNNNDMFRAPYVFANGVKTAALPKPKTSQKIKQGNKPKTKIEKVIQKSNEQESKKKDVPNVTFVIPDDEAYKNVTVDEKGDIKTYLITATTIGKTGKQLGWNKSNAEKLKQAMLDKFAELEKAGIKIDGASMKVFNAYKKFKGFNVFLHVKEDGTAQLTIDFQTKPTKVGGVYSQKRGKGKIDIPSAKTWLQTALGLSDDQVLVTNGVMRGLHNEKVYALTNIACSQIVDSVYGFITLSKKGGIGLEYHEAWHYVNLLLHNRTMRSKIYEKYRSAHPELKGATFREIEEYLAEDFRSYMLGFEDKTWSARIKRFFKNIKQIVKAFFGKPDVIYQAYKNIKNGKYAGAKLDPQSVEEFKLNFPDGVYFVIPGLTNDQVTKFTNIQNYHQYYQCAELLCNKVMEGLDLSSVSKLKNYSKEDFDAIFAGIQQQIDNDPESENSKLLQDVVDNKDAFYKTVSTMLKTFSIDVKHKKLKLDADITNGKDTGDVADNIWDIDHMEVSKKINVGFKAKLFFSTIPVYDVKTDEHGELVYIPNIDPLFGSQNYWSFSKGWNKIMSELWSCDNFDGIDDSTGQYSSTSLIGMVQRLSKSGDKFFRAMEEKLEPLIDEDDESLSPEEKLEIKTQILNTIQSSKNRISVLSINAPKHTTKKQDVSNQIMSDNALGIDDEAISKTPDILIDINKQWVIQDSEHLQSKYILARTWSENLLSGSGIVETDPKTGDNFVSTAYMRKLKQLINTATQAVAVQKTQTQNFAKNTKYKSIEDAKSAICCVLNYMAIPADGQVIQQLINTELSLNPNSYPETDLAEKERHVLREMLNGSGTATIQKLYGQLSTANRGKTITIGKNGEKDLSDFYKGYSTVMSRVKGKKTTKGLPWIGKLTVAYAKTYPSSAEMSVTGANGAQIYPINQNNAVSDFLHRLQNDTDNELEKKKATSYTQGSIIVENAENDRVYSTPEEEKLHLNTFVCVKDMESGNSGDYFGITPLEDYVAKFIMTYNKHLTFPTMADKKTWYSITSRWLTDHLNTDVILTNSENPKLSTGTIDIFSRYFYDELKSLKEYYAKDNIKALLKDPNKLLVNFHGSIVTDELDLPGNKKYKYTHLDFNGNGGKFRYFYDISKFDGLNLNQKLELEYKTEYLENVKRAAIGDTASITDGFERIRIFLDGILKEDVESQEYTKSVEQLRNSINAMLLEKVKAEIDVLSSDENMHLIQHVGDNYFNYGLPNDILKYYQNQIKEQLRDVDGDTLRNSAIYSAIANHVLRTMISIIEVEKIFTGDPAMYKWIMYKDKQLSETTKNSLTKKVTLEDGSVEQVQVSMLQSKDVDKIKRLGAVLSPGTNLKTQWTNSEKEILKDFGTSKYTFMNVSDINVKSVFLDDIRTIFTQNELVQALKRSYDDKYIIEHFSKALNLDPENVKRVEKIYYTIYSHPEYIDKIFKILQNTKGDTIVENIKSRVDDSISPYDGINVADAQVCLRPSIYRKLRIATGEWSFSEDETGYSDEKAYNIIENDDDWMSDPEKYEIGRKLMLKPLKMSYFSNSTTTNIGIYNVSLPVYNKMAMFPMFKYVCQSSVGRALYERMNMPGNEIDMFGFDSAVKVGCNQNRYQPYKKGTTDLSTMDMESLKLPSNASIDYQTGEVRQALPGKKTLAVQIQDMNNLHLQLNTDAHEHDERSIGSQMMKICFSNVDPNMRYGKDGQKGEGRLGSAIRNDIMNIINAMTQIGTDNIKKRFFKKDREGKYTIPNKQRIQDYILSICENNDLGLSSEEIIRSGGKVASLTARQIFEQSVSSMINKEVIDINTNGGAAIQQSCFGFVGHGRSSVLSEKDIRNVSLYSTKVEELDLSVRLLKVLQAGKIETVIDILNNKYYIQSHLGKKLQSEIQDLLDNFALSWEDGLTEEQLKNAKFSKRHVLNNGEPLRWYNKKGTMEVMLSLNFFRQVIPEKYKTDYTTMRQWLIDNDVIKGTKSDGTQSNPKPFGVGYRIPTQGMSSTFGFIVADVLPETSSDLIIVPTEFTAQTGSDFDKHQCRSKSV